MPLCIMCIQFAGYMSGVNVLSKLCVKGGHVSSI